MNNDFIASSDKAEAQHVELVSDDAQPVIAGSDPDAIYTLHDDTDDSFYSIKDVFYKSPVVPLLVLFCNFGIIAYGYDNMILSMVLNFLSFQMRFGSFVEGTWIIPAYWQSIWNALAQVATMIGAVVTGYLKDTIGRKWTFNIGAILSIVGTAVIYTSTGPGSYLAGKIINAIGLGIVQATGQTYVAEICPTRFRGVGLGFWGIGLGFGALIGSVVAGKLLEKYYTEEYGYKACFASQWAWGGILFIGSVFMPESPYHCVRKGNIEKAKKQLIKLHGKNNTRIIDVTLKHLQEIEAIEKMRALEKTSYIECFRGTNWRRTRIILYGNGYNQLIGTTVIGNAAYFLTMAGLSSSRTTMIIQIGSSFGLLSTILVLVGMVYINRRPLILGAAVSNVFVYLSMGICSSIKGDKALLGVGLSLMLIYITMGPSIAPLMTVASEVPSMRLRAKSMSIGFGFQYFFSTVMNVVVPYMFNSDQGDLGGKIGWIFFATSLIGTIALFFLIPETKGRHFTEIDELFELRIPTRAFGSFTTTAQANGHSAVQNGHTSSKETNAVEQTWSTEA